MDRDVEEVTGDRSLESELDEIIDAYSTTRLGVAYAQEAFSLVGEYVFSATVRHAISRTSLVVTAVTLPLAAVLYYRALLRANLAGPEAWGASWGRSGCRGIASGGSRTSTWSTASTRSSSRHTTRRTRG